VNFCKFQTTENPVWHMTIEKYTSCVFCTSKNIDHKNSWQAHHNISSSLSDKEKSFSYLSLVYFEGQMWNFTLLNFPIQFSTRIEKMDLTTLLSIFIIFIITYYSIHWYLSIPENLPPGPRGLPFLGSILELKFAKNDVLVLEKWARKYGPLFKFYLGRKLVVVLAKYGVVEKSLIKQADAYSGRPIFRALYTERFHKQRTGEKINIIMCHNLEANFQLKEEWTLR